MSSPDRTSGPLPVRWFRAFGRFWWDFLVGDTPELTAATLVIVGITLTLARTVSSTAAWVTLPALVIVALLLSVWRGHNHP